MLCSHHECIDLDRISNREGRRSLLSLHHDAHFFSASAAALSLFVSIIAATGPKIPMHCMWHWYTREGVRARRAAVNLHKLIFFSDSGLKGKGSRLGFFGTLPISKGKFLFVSMRWDEFELNQLIIQRFMRGRLLLLNFVHAWTDG